MSVYEATYGHPKGSTSTGRMSYDVMEIIIQSMIDQNGGSYLCLSSFYPLTRMFGDPCPGYTKDLRIRFEILGRKGQLTYPEIHGYLAKRISILQSPLIAPIIYVISGTYGITPTARKDCLDTIHKQLKKIEYIEHRKREGLVVQPEDVVYCKRKPDLLRLRKVFQEAPTKFVDICVKLQHIADQQGKSLLLERSAFDPNAVFGNPLPGLPKLLQVYVDCQGHDSEKVTELNEMQETGYARNFITMKKGRFNIVVEDDVESGRGIMRESLEFLADYASPILIITKAIYGELHDLTKCIDVTNEIQSMVVGRTLIIEKDLNLNVFFKRDPSPGRQKQLQIKYITRGFTGNLRVREKNDYLVAGVELGFPPIPPPDDENLISD